MDKDTGKIIALTIYVLALVTRAKSTCLLTDWSPWSEWRSSVHDDTIESFPVPTRADPAQSLTTMTQAMLMKRDTIEEKLYCMMDESCPELDAKSAEGFVPCIEGFAGEIPCWNINQMSFLPKQDMDPEGVVMFASDIWGWTDPVNGDEYSIMGYLRGTSFVRITDPQNPVAAGFMYYHNGSNPSFWRDMKVVDGYVYIVSEGVNHGIQVFDLTRLRGHPVENVTVFEPDAHYDLVGNCHNVIANEQVSAYVYVVGCTEDTTLGCGGGLHVVDVTDPLEPLYAGCWGGDGYVHDAQCVIYSGPDTDHQGKEICFCYDVDVFSVVDVSDKADMQLISRTSYTSAAYTHQGWLTEDQTVVLMDDEQDEKDLEDSVQKTYIWDVSDLDNPVLMNTYRAPFEFVDHNQYIVGDLVYQANYEAGLRVLNIDQENYQLSEVAYFDVFPNRTTAEFFGAWSVYPFFESENIIISSIEFGLYTVRLDLPEISQMIEERRTQSKERTRHRKVLSADDLQDCPDLIEVQRT